MNTQTASEMRNISMQQPCVITLWTLKDKIINYSLKWKIIDRGSTYRPSGKNCSLWDLEKFYIISRPELASLNQRNELATSCRHRKKHLLCNK